MDMYDSDFELGSQTLRDIEMQEIAMMNRPNSDIIECSQPSIEESPIAELKSLSERFRLVSQKRSDKTKSESRVKDPERKRSNFTENSLTLSRMIRQEVENIDINAW